MSSSRRDPKKYTPPASPTVSYYDLSDDDDDEEEEYSTITHTATGRGVKLLYSKSKVCLWTRGRFYWRAPWPVLSDEVN